MKKKGVEKGVKFSNRNTIHFLPEQNKRNKDDFYHKLDKYQIEKQLETEVCEERDIDAEEEVIDAEKEAIDAEEEAIDTEKGAIDTEERRQAREERRQAREERRQAREERKQARDNLKQDYYNRKQARKQAHKASVQELIKTQLVTRKKELKLKEQREDKWYDYIVNRLNRRRHRLRNRKIRNLRFRQKKYKVSI